MHKIDLLRTVSALSKSFAASSFVEWFETTVPSFFVGEEGSDN